MTRFIKVDTATVMSLDDIRLTGLCVPDNPVSLSDFGYEKITEVPMPEPAFTQEVIDEGVKHVNGEWTQTWLVADLTGEKLEARLAELEAKQVRAEADRVRKLWEAAHNYEFAQISGSAIGLLAMGVMQGKPKCLAVQNWIKGIWTEYYVRKASSSTNFDFSIAGECPHTVPEIMVELGV
jgi:hypothetical protein